jgi:DNA-binding PucR family transcriptional regulator
MQPVVGVGPVAADLAGLAHSRACTDRALRVLREGRGERRVARLEDIHVEALVLELRDLVAARGDQPTGSLAQLIEYDRQHQTHLVETLQAWLDAFGDVTAASEALFLHPNTFRYRLRRLAEVGDINLSDPEQRFVAMLQLRVLAQAWLER